MNHEDGNRLPSPESRVPSPSAPDLEARMALATFSGQWTMVAIHGDDVWGRQGCSTWEIVPAYETDPAAACSLLPVLCPSLYKQRKENFPLLQECDTWQLNFWMALIRARPDEVCALMREAVGRVGGL